MEGLEAGLAVGNCDGRLLDGNTVGGMLGATAGVSLGTSLGGDGSAVNVDVGFIVRTIVGSAVGHPVGTSEGCAADGYSVGTKDWGKVGAREARFVRAGFRVGLGDWCTEGCGEGFHEGKTVGTIDGIELEGRSEGN